MLLQSVVPRITSVEILIFALIFSPSLVKMLSYTVPDLQITCRLQTDTILTWTSFSSFLSNLSVSRLLIDSLSHTIAFAWQQSVSQLLCKADIKSTCKQFFYLKNVGGCFNIRSSLNVFMTQVALWELRDFDNQIVTTLNHYYCSSCTDRRWLLK
jgi:hypothetical protein